MSRATPAFSLGIEEEYSLVDIKTRDLAKDTPPKLLAELTDQLGGRFSTKFARSQIEIATSVCSSTAEAGRQVFELRQRIVEAAAPYGLAPMAAATHPFSRWKEQRHRNTPRYNDIAEEFRGVGRRMIINGLHVHVGIPDKHARIAVMNDIRAYLPILLALSTSSPFWDGEATGLKSYRSAINDATPRTGIPEVFLNWASFQQAMDTLVKAGLIQDASMVWWDIRPSNRFPTLELRIADVCPRLEDGVAIAALYHCLCRYLFRALENERKSMTPPLVLLNENRWRAERFGISDGLLDYGTGRVTPLSQMVGRLLDLIADDAVALDCESDIEHALTIARRGTSADRQVAKYRKLRREKLSHRAAMKGVVDMLLEETASDPAIRQRRRSNEKRAGDSGMRSAMRY